MALSPVPRTVKRSGRQWKGIAGRQRAHEPRRGMMVPVCGRAHDSTRFGLAHSAADRA
jgi:hypothetical protein